MCALSSKVLSKLRLKNACEQTCRLFNRMCATVQKEFELHIELCMACCMSSFSHISWYLIKLYVGNRPDYKSLTCRYKHESCR